METLRVLVTDDEQGMRLGVRRILQRFVVDVPEVDSRSGFEIDQAECGETALEKIAEQPPDILILDHKMPGISGLEVLERMGQAGETLVIMVTAYASIETAVQAIKRGAYDFLAKPFTPDELRNTVRKAAVRLVLARQARRLADQRNEVRLQFMQVLSHELQAPLNAVDGYLDMLRRGVRGEAIAAYHPLVERSQARIAGMRKLIRDLLDMTRIESGRRRELLPLDLRELARSACEVVAESARRQGVSIHVHAAAPVPITADAEELAIVLNNLLTNAVKYNRTGGEVHVTLDRNGDSVSLSVADTGIGIAAGDIDRLFDEFVRIKSEQTRQIDGNGLGLSIVRKIVRQYGGEITVHSEPGQGSTFTAVLPDVPGGLPYISSGQPLAAAVSAS